MTEPVTTALVVTYHTGPRLHECLHALDGDPAVSFIRIVNNGNPPEESAWLQAFADARETVTLLDEVGNIGFGRAVNFASERAPDGNLLIINPDAVLKRGSVEKMIKAASALPAPWIVGGKIFDKWGVENRGPRRRKLTLFRALTTYAGWNTWTLEATPAPREPVPMDVVSGALMLTDTKSFALLKGFDERYFMHVEDVDICRRAGEAGGCVMYVPDAGALHYGATSDAPSKTVAAYKGDSLAHYFRKFASNPAERLLAELITPIITAILVSRAKDQG
ncbi:glycosyltransferase family 2 protein [Henriciella litoralis]|uniref:glycosyltransferase family 2 protein n=1 Tax=Henriciella litoralis TaxID=568102 RepID=UPI000A0721B2|nr:glycosyltransferase family 2 protein [Henriciella litoralis]